MSCPALTNKGGKLYISDQPVDCDLTLSELAVLDYVFVPGVGSIGDTGIEQDIVTYPTTDAGLTAQGKGDAVARNWDIEVLDAPSQARDILDDASAIGNDDNYATRIEWPDGDVEFSIVQVASRTAVKGAASGVRVIRYTMVPSFVPIVTNALPVASNVVVTGTYFVGDTLTATYDYYSPLGLPESGSAYQWYADGVAIPGADGLTYEISATDYGSMISFGVEPSDGLTFGNDVRSASGGPVDATPEFLFQNGTYGGLYLPYQPDHLYADEANTVPAALGGGIASFDDLSGNAVTGPQSVSTARPIMGRMPVSGVRNLLEQSYELDGSYYNQGNVVVTDSSTPAPSGDNWYHIAVDSATAVTAFYPLIHAFPDPILGPRRFSFYAKAGELGFVKFGMWLNSTNYNVVTVDLSTGSVKNNAGFSGGFGPFTNVEIEPDADGYRISGTAELSVTGTVPRRLYILPSSDGAVGGNPFESQTGDGASGIYIASLQYEDGEDTTAYQRVGNAYDVTEAGVPSVYYAHYDLADDVLPQDATLPAITDGTVILIGKDGVWIDEGYSFAGGSWSLGPTTYTGGPDGIIGIVGDMLDLVVLDRPLTTDERDVMVAYGVNRGAAGLFELGPELVVNGTFDTDVSGWILLQDNLSADIEWDAGTIRVTATGGNAGYATQAGVTMPPGSPFIISITSLNSDGRTGAHNAKSVSGVDNIFALQASVGTRYGVASTGTGEVWVLIGSSTDGVVTHFDNISVRRLIMPGETP